MVSLRLPLLGLLNLTWSMQPDSPCGEPAKDTKNCTRYGSTAYLWSRARLTSWPTSAKASGTSALDAPTSAAAIADCVMRLGGEAGEARDIGDE